MKYKTNINKPFEQICKEVEGAAKCVFGENMNKTKQQGSIVYVPHHPTLGNMSEVTVVVRKVNNSTSHIDVEFNEKSSWLQFEDMRHSICKRWYDAIVKICRGLSIQFNCKE